MCKMLTGRRMAKTSPWFTTRMMGDVASSFPWASCCMKSKRRIGLAPGETKERDLSWLDVTYTRGMSDDGRTVLLGEGGFGGGANGSIYLRKTDGSPAIRLGDGYPISLSPDGKWALTRLRNTTP